MQENLLMRSGYIYFNLLTYVNDYIHEFTFRK